MPEGHTLHRLASEIRERFSGDAVQFSSPQGRFAADAARIDGRALVDAEAWGKHLLLDADDELWVHVHLGIFGRFTFGGPPAPDVVGQVRLRMIGPRAWADLRGPNACRLLDASQREELLARLGPDPLRDDADPERAWARISRSRTPIAALLMDQSVVAGAGNIYRAEVLFRHGVDPMLPGRQLSASQWAALWQDLRLLMKDGVRAGRIDTVRPEHDPEVTGRAPRVDRHGGEVYVYRRAGQPCHVCGTPVASTVLAGRNLFWCPTCQASAPPLSGQ
jgi:endonuclease-8/formamidopyrimidine-DNA glycosylase